MSKAKPPSNGTGSGRTDLHNGHSETTPLLASTTSDPPVLIDPGTPVAEDDKDDDDSLPKGQVFLLCFARLVEPVAFFGIFPFINKMIWEAGGLDEEDVGFYSGLIESLFSLTQMLLMLSWGRAADRFGRKPVLVTSLIGCATATSLFGLSRAIWQMMLLRCCAGLFAGTIVTVRAMLSEVSTQKTQARAFSFFAFSGNVGIFLGPLIGGALSNPSEQYPSLFGHVKFFNVFPYALPTFTTGAVGFVAAISCALFIKETLKRKQRDSASAENQMTTWDILRSPGVPVCLFLYGHVMLLGLAYTAVSPVFWFTRPELGGYGFNPQQISMFIAAIGVSQALWLVLAFPPLQRKYGTGSVLRGCLNVWPILFIGAPLCNYFLRQGWTTAFWIVAPITQILGAGVAMAFTCVQLALNDIAPSPYTLGTLNALALTLVSGVRTVGPAIFTSLFAAGTRTRVFGGYLVWVVLVLIAVAGRVTVRWLPPASEGQKKSNGILEDNQNGARGTVEE